MEFIESKDKINFYCTWTIIVDCYRRSSTANSFGNPVRLHGIQKRLWLKLTSKKQAEVCPVDNSMGYTQLQTHMQHLHLQVKYCCGFILDCLYSKVQYLNCTITTDDKAMGPLNIFSLMLW